MRSCTPAQRARRRPPTRPSWTFADGSFQQTVYDAAGRSTARIDELGRTTQFGYDAFGRLTSVTDAKNGLTQYAYDEIGNRIEQTDANGHVTAFEYDSRRRETKRTLPDGVFETTGYGPSGELLTRTDFMERTTAYSYDVMHRLLARRYPDSSVVSFTYTPIGRRATVVDSRGTTSYGYDSRDRVTSLTYPDGRKLEYGYDALGARTSLTAKVGERALTTEYTYDADERPDLATDALGRVFDADYDAVGRRTALAYPNHTGTSYAYDVRNRLASINAVQTVTSALVHSYAFTTDVAGNRTRIEEGDGTAKVYGHDELSRLTSETVSGGSGPNYAKTFTYDAVGNRSTQVTTGSGVGSVTYSYDSRDRLVSENSMAYASDANGNLVSKSGDATYVFDVENRLVAVTMADGTTVVHTYDADGNRVKTVSTPPSGPAQVSGMLVDAVGGLSHVVAETDGGGALTNLYVRLGDELLAVMRPAGGGTWATRYVHHDALGSVRAVTDEAGTVADARSYEAFGTKYRETGSDALAYGFAGEAFDGASGLAYHRARWMDAKVGRFLGTDPERGRSRDPRSLHPYTYASNYPTLFIDPSGRQSLAELSAVTIAVGILANTNVAHAVIGSVVTGGGVPDAVGFGAIGVLGAGTGNKSLLPFVGGFGGIEIVFFPRRHQVGIAAFGAFEGAVELQTPDPSHLASLVHPEWNLEWYTSYYFGFPGFEAGLSNFDISGFAAGGGFVGASGHEFLFGGSLVPGTESWGASGTAGTVAGPWIQDEATMVSDVTTIDAAVSALDGIAIGRGSGNLSLLVGGAIAAPVNAATAYFWVHNQYGK